MSIDSTTNERESTYEREREDTTPTIGDAVRRHWRLAAGILALCTLAGLLWPFTVPVRYVAQAQLIAGANSVDAGGVAVSTSAGQSLAETYSRVFSGDQVREILRERVGNERPDVTASPIPGSSIILIEARGASEAEAIQIADASVDALVTVVSDLLNNDEAVAAATARLTQAYVDLATAEDAAGGADDDDVTGALSARAEVASAQSAVEAYDALLTDLIQNSVQSNGVRRLASAQVTSDTSTQRFQLGGAIGLVLGAALGSGAAYARALSDGGSRRRTPRVVETS